MHREIDEAKLKRDWKLGIPINKMAEKYNVPKYVLYYHAGRLGLKPRIPGLRGRIVRSDGTLLISDRVCKKLGLSKGERFIVEILDKDEKTIKLVKV